MNKLAFETYVAKVLASTLEPGDIIAMDNLPSHKDDKVCELIEVKGATRLLLPPYSPDLNPIDMAFAELKAVLRKAAVQTVGALSNRIGQLVDA